MQQTPCSWYSTRAGCFALKILFARSQYKFKGECLMETRVTHYRNDQLISEEIYDKNDKLKYQKTYYNNGQLKSEIRIDGNNEYRQRWHENSQLSAEEYLQNGTFYKEDGLARSYWHENGQLAAEIYYNEKGQLHRTGNPAVRSWHPNGQLKSETWYQNNKVHRTDGPAHQEWHESGQLTYQQEMFTQKELNGVGEEKENNYHIFRAWHLNGQPKSEIWYCINPGSKFRRSNEYHRENGPAIQEWYPNGQIKKEEWYFYDLPHRQDEPACQEWHENGQVALRRWYNHGSLYRENGPAGTKFDEYGNLTDQSFCHINGERVPLEEYLIFERAQKLKANQSSTSSAAKI